MTLSLLLPEVPAVSLGVERTKPVRSFVAAPRAAQLIESMRDVGYDLEMALADVIDNAITAGARRIDVLADTDPAQPRIAILDDGLGMSEEELHAAMRLGSRDPLDQRAADDLGRFGLGMKTASFSQCRRLTVVTRKGGVTSAARWDLDQVRESDQWLVGIPDCREIRWITRLGDHGTLVLWEQLDRLSEGANLSQSHMTRRLHEARDHLELVFHRFLHLEGHHRPITMALNGDLFKGIDPLQFGKSLERQVEQINLRGLGRVTVQAVTLPHHSKVSKRDWERIGGLRGHARTQGFYVYRERRLIIWGTWFGLAQQLETTKLARVRIDIPNTMDAAWKIDIRKASAHPPPAVRRKLKCLIETICEPSRRVYTERGPRLVSPELTPLWIRILKQGVIRYRPYDEHPVQKAFLASLNDEQRLHFENYMELLGATLPVDGIFNDFATTPRDLSSDVSDAAMEQAIRDSMMPLVLQQVPLDMVAGMLQRREPFKSDWSRARRIIDRVWQEEATA